MLVRTQDPHARADGSGCDEKEFFLPQCATYLTGDCVYQIVVQIAFFIGEKGCAELYDNALGVSYRFNRLASLSLQIFHVFMLHLPGAAVKHSARP